MLNNPDLRIGVFFLAVALLFGIFMVPKVKNPWRLPFDDEEEVYSVGPRFFPYVAAAVVGGISLLLVVQGWRNRDDSEKAHAIFSAGQLKSAAQFVLIGTAFVVLLPLLGMLLATPLCLAAFFWHYGARQWQWVCVAPLGITAIIYFCFVRLMAIPLPEGILG